MFINFSTIYVMSTFGNSKLYENQFYRETVDIGDTEARASHPTLCNFYHTSVYVIDFVIDFFAESARHG